MGGTHAEPAVTDTNREGLEEAPDAAPLEPAGEVLLTVAFQLLHAGAVTLDGPGKLVFPHGLRPVGGMYRLTLHPADAGGRPQVYIGESQDVCRRLTGNYRNPNPGQATSQRISDALRDHLRGGGRVSLDVAYAATVTREAHRRHRCVWIGRPVGSWPSRLEWCSCNSRARQTCSTWTGPAAQRCPGTPARSPGQARV